MENTQIVVVPGKVPFHYGLFFSAVRHCLGEPTQRSNLGDDGYYDYCWEVTPELKKKIREGIVTSIGTWMKCFDLEWPESRCDVAKWPNSPDSDKEYLRITISHKKPEAT